MNRAEILQLIIECIESVNPDAGNNITEDTNLLEDAVLDSLDAMTFVFKLEKKANIKLKSITEDSVDLSVKTLIDELSG